jgi:hypothetical protein
MTVGALAKSGTSKTTSKSGTAASSVPLAAGSTREETIRLCAYTKWEAAGRPLGDGVQFWLEAEQDLLAGK